MMIDQEIELIKQYSLKNKVDEANIIQQRNNLQSIILEETESLGQTDQKPSLIDPSFIMAQQHKPLLSTKANYSSAL